MNTHSNKPITVVLQRDKKKYPVQSIMVACIACVVGALIISATIVFVRIRNADKQKQLFMVQSSQRQEVAVNQADEKKVYASWTDLIEMDRLNSVLIDISTRDSDIDGITDWKESEYKTDPNNPDTDSDGFSDGVEMNHGYDPTGSGRLYMDVVIPKINTIAPISFPVSRNENDIQTAMEAGIAHYPGTAIPGTNGNAYITGHSSDYVWRTGHFKRVFKNLNSVEVGDTVHVRETLGNGTVITYTYHIFDKQVMPVDDIRLWTTDRDGSIITLVTSWPVGTTKERLMVRGELAVK